MSTIDEDKTINAVKQGFAEGFMTLTPQMEHLFRIVYRAGYKQGEIEELEKRLEEVNEARSKIPDVQSD